MADVVEQQKNSSRTVLEFFQQEKVSPSNFYKYKKLAASKGRFALVKSVSVTKNSILEPINDRCRTNIVASSDLR
jgi:hypothetical protein